MLRLTTLGFLIVALLSPSMGYSSGPPLSVCQSMTPNHYGTSPQTSSSPYSITLNATSYSPDEVIQVTVGGNPGFKGVFIQARNPGSNVAVGTFAIPTNDDHLKTLDCNSNAKSAVSHRKSTVSTTKTVYWRAPPTSTGNIQFKVTFVQSKSVYWVGVTSMSVTASSVDPVSNGLTSPGPSGSSPAQRTTVAPSGNIGPNSSSTLKSSLGLFYIALICVFKLVVYF